MGKLLGVHDKPKLWLKLEFETQENFDIIASHNSLGNSTVTKLDPKSYIIEVPPESSALFILRTDSSEHSRMRFSKFPRIIYSEEAYENALKALIRRAPDR